MDSMRIRGKFGWNRYVFQGALSQTDIADQDPYTDSHLLVRVPESVKRLRQHRRLNCYYRVRGTPCSVQSDSHRRHCVCWRSEPSCTFCSARSTEYTRRTEAVDSGTSILVSVRSTYQHQVQILVYNCSLPGSESTDRQSTYQLSVHWRLCRVDIHGIFREMSWNEPNETFVTIYLLYKAATLYTHSSERTRNNSEV